MLKPESTEPRCGGTGKGCEGQGGAIVGADLGQLGQWLPAVAVGAAHGGTGGSGKRSLAHLARVGETFDWLAGEDDVRGVPAADHAIRKGVAGRAAGRGRQWPAHPRANRWGRCRVRRRAERVSRPAREKKRRRRVLVVTRRSPRPMRAVQRARL